jgi:outer membrane biosynthesis protein TonB
MTAIETAFTAPPSTQPSALKALTLAASLSLVLHGLSFVALDASGVRVNVQTDDLDSHILEASLVPAHMITAPDISLQSSTSKSISDPMLTGMTMLSVPKTAPKPAPKSKNTSAPEAVVEPQTETPQTSAPIAEPNAVAQPPETAPLPATPEATVVEAKPLSPTVVMPAVAAPSAPAPEPEAIKSKPYLLPNQLSVRYEANANGFQGKSVLSWKKSTDAQSLVTQYEAQLLSSASILFKTYEHRFKSTGVINSSGLAPLFVEEKRTNGSTISTTVEPDKNRVVISSKEGYLPYDPTAHDLVSLMVQLAIYAQTQPLWHQAGTAQDFTVYRPSGIKRWRFQSFGVTNIILGERQLSTIYVRRVAVGTEPDYESQYHFWLDLNHYGFPVKMRIVDTKNNTTDINMTAWQEQ